NFSAFGFQPTYWAISELAKTADMATRAELAEILLTLAGHLFATNFFNRFFAQRAVEAAFTLKAELVAKDNPSKRQGYAAAVYGLTTPLLSVPGLKEWSERTPLQLAQHLPEDIHRAFAAVDRKLLDAGMMGEGNLNPPESERAAFEAAREKVGQTANRLLDL